VIPVKAGFFANIKSCNYLPNVLMKKEAVDHGVDFVFSFDEHDHLGEGPTESAAIVSADGWLLSPPDDRVLPGTTVVRVRTLAREMVAEGLLGGVDCRAIARKELRGARELLVIGTTPDVVPVVEFDGHPVGDGRPGPVAIRLGELLREDISRGATMRTPVFDGP
jgi:branched-chain amino acid aminotransferase